MEKTEDWKQYLSDLIAESQFNVPLKNNKIDTLIAVDKDTNFNF